MKPRVYSPQIAIALACLALLQPHTSSAQSQADEIKECRQRLSNIYEAIQAYRLQHKDLPAELTDLVPEHLANPATLSCPTALRSGVGSAAVSGRTKPDSTHSKTTYHYEFSLTPIDPRIMPEGSTHTVRDWKQLQMGLVGSAVPLVRCLSHPRTLNLAFDGQIYESTPDWEDSFRKVVEFDDLRPQALFARYATVNTVTTLNVVIIEKRDPHTPAQLIDLSDHYNASLKKGWHSPDTGNNLAELPSGQIRLKGVEFDVRGVVQLGSGKYLTHYPTAVTNVAVGLRCRGVHFLHAASHPEETDTPVAQYVLHFSDGRTEKLEILYGRHLIDWWSNPNKPGRFEKPLNSRIAWSGSNKPAKGGTQSIHLYDTSWTNPRPNVTIQSLDLLSTRTESAPFIVAITAELPTKP